MAMVVLLLVVVVVAVEVMSSMTDCVPPPPYHQTCTVLSRTGHYVWWDGDGGSQSVIEDTGLHSEKQKSEFVFLFSTVVMSEWLCG